MARRKQEFRPDVRKVDWAGKLLPTPRQWKQIIKWTLFSLVCLIGLLVQDAVMPRFKDMGITTDLAACCILAVSIMQGAHSGCIFTLCAAALYYFSGSAPGPYCIFFLTVIGVLGGMFRQNFLRKGFITLFLCVVAALVVYEMSLFGVGLLLGHTTVARVGVFLLTALMSSVAVVLLYPVFVSIGKIGGEVWNE